MYLKCTILGISWEWFFSVFPNIRTTPYKHGITFQTTPPPTNSPETKTGFCTHFHGPSSFLLAPSQPSTPADLRHSRTMQWQEAPAVLQRLVTGHQVLHLRDFGPSVSAEDNPGKPWWTAGWCTLKALTPHSPWKMVVGRRSFPIGKVTFQRLC